MEASGLRTIGYETALALIQEDHSRTVKNPGYSKHHNSHTGRFWRKLSEVWQICVYIFANRESSYAHGVTVNVAGEAEDKRIE